MCVEMILCCKVTKNAPNECNFLRKTHSLSAIFNKKCTGRVQFLTKSALAECKLWDKINKRE